MALLNKLDCFIDETDYDFINRDDNKILTLASNERIALTPEMRLIFEISNLRTATPATVSRYQKTHTWDEI